MEAALVPVAPSPVDLPAVQLTTLVEVATEQQDIPALKDVAAMAEALQKGARKRSLGIEHENKAAEVVLLAERGIGKVLIELREAGRYMRGPAASAKYARGDQALDGRTVKAAPEHEKVRLSDFSITGQQASDFQKLASLSDDEFKARIEEARAEGRRLAKQNFYKAGPPVTQPRKPEPERPGLREFQAFRTGAQALVAWEVGEDGIGRSLENRFEHLTDDELAQVKVLVEAIAARYGETVKARRAH